MKWLLCGLVLSAVAQVSAQEVSAQSAKVQTEKNWAEAFPPGSIKTAEDVQRALQAAHAESVRAERTFTEGKARCAKSFLVTSCENKIKGENKQSRALVRRVELEAHDRQRVLDAQARDERRAAEQQSAKTKVPAVKIDEKRVTQNNEQRLKRQAETAQHQAEYDKKVQAQQQRAAEREAAAPGHAAEAEAFARKQAEAQHYAEQKAKQKEENQTRRAARKKEREEEAARRESAVPVP